MPSNRSRERASWHRALLKEWATKGIDRCEICGGTFGLALAHSLKRRFITTREQYFEVALLDQKCHERIEFSGHENMEAEVKRIIEAR